MERVPSRRTLEAVLLVHGDATMSDTAPSSSELHVAEPSDNEKRFDMRVLIPHMRAYPHYTMQPWVRITANSVTEEITMAAGIKIHRKDDEEDGA